MAGVRTHCYECATTLPAGSDDSGANLARAGWLVLDGSLYCPACAAQKAPAPAQPEPGSSQRGDPRRARDVAALGAMAARVQRAVVAGVWLLALGIFVPALRTSTPTLIGGGIAVICGPVVLWRATRWRPLLREARQSLMMVPVPLLLERTIPANRSDSSWNAKLATTDGQPAALISDRWQQATPKFLTGTSIPVLVYGGLSDQATIVASGAAGVVVGRIVKDLRAPLATAARMQP